MTSRIVDLNRKRALSSYKNIKNFIENLEDKDKAKNLRSYCRKIPVYIKKEGLIATLMFIKAKAKDEEKNEYSYLYEWIKDWLVDVANIKDDSNFLQQIMSVNREQYRICTEEVLNLLTWYKRNAEGMIDA